jgi:hypothetical protein
MTMAMPLCPGWKFTSTVVFGCECRAALSSSSATASTTGSTARLTTASLTWEWTCTRR